MTRSEQAARRMQRVATLSMRRRGRFPKAAEIVADLDVPAEDLRVLCRDLGAMCSHGKTDPAECKGVVASAFERGLLWRPSGRDPRPN